MTDLRRFVDAQSASYANALAEVRAGSKRSHWMWFIFPQLAGLGRSAMAQRYAIKDIAEARIYLDHPMLGPRLREITAALLDLDCADPEHVFGGVDSMKLRSSLTLFAHADDGSPNLFREALARCFDDREDPATAARL